jgi:hypothetical protein
MKKAILFTLLLMAFSSCGKLFQFFILGIRQAKPETQESIISYGKKVGYDTNEHFYFIDSAEVQKTWKGSFPKAFIYDDEGYIVKHLDCFATSLNDLKAFYNQPLGTAPRISNTALSIFGTDTIKTIAPAFEDLKNSVHGLNNSKVIDLPKAKYYLVFYWSKSFGKINKKRGVEMEKYLLSHPEFSTAFIKINCDYQKQWGYTKKDLR